MPRIFATGVTGYIGGDAIYSLLTAHPDYEISCLIRDTAKAEEVLALHPSIRIVHGTLDDDQVLEEEASKTDIVLNFANGSHEAAVRALVAGLTRRQGTGYGYLVHTMGTGTMIFDDIRKGRFGEHSDKIYNDLDGLPDVLAVPDFAKARGAENAVREAGVKNAGRIKTAVVSTASAYGAGRGLVQYRTSAIHELVRCTLQRGDAVYIGAGKSAWRNVHIQDLSDVYVKLVEHAISPDQSHQVSDGPSVWGGTEGFYFIENGEHVWGELAAFILKEAVNQGLISASSGVVSIDAKEAGSLAPMANFFWGCNARVQGKRARQALSWQPTGTSLNDEIKVIVKKEADKLKAVK